MSCHNIGHALNSVQRKIIEKYELGKIDKETTRELLIRCVRAVGFCDGNEYEATASFDAAYCSDCMRKVADGEKLYDIFWIDTEPRKVHKYHKDNLYIGSMLCDDCFTKMCTSLGLSPEEIENEKKRQFPN